MIAAAAERRREGREARHDHRKAEQNAELDLRHLRLVRQIGDPASLSERGGC